MFTPQAKRKIPILMATQHPDNACKPFWGSSPEISSQQEMDEIYHIFRELACDEYMWDWEGKFADEAMVERLLTNHTDEFKKKQLGRDRFVTVRIPNIWEEKTFKLARAYMAVLSAGEFLKSLKLHTPPIFELILPMTRKADQLIHIQKTFQKTAQLHQSIFENTDFGEGYIHIIPIFESVDDLAASGALLEKFLRLHKEHFGFYPPYLRPFIARSDPALNSGFVSAVLGSQLALREFYRVEKKYAIPMHPIIGTGSLPFRGGINPENIERSLPQYRSVKTVTIQSAFRYDYPLEDVKKALAYIAKELKNVKPLEFSDDDFAALKSLCELFTGFYRPTVEAAAPLINEMAHFIPNRRERVQHVGLFGYSRGVGQVTLPRAIKFTGACYSLGVPPEFIGTGRALRAAQKKGLLDLTQKYFYTMQSELKHAGKFINMENLEHLAEHHDWAKDVLEDIHACQEILQLEIGPKKERHLLHRNLTSNISLKRHMGEDFADDIVEAAEIRKSLG